MALTPKDVLAILASFKTNEGIEPLKVGYIQDVAVEPHGEKFRVNIHVDDVWGNDPLSSSQRERMSSWIMGRLSHVQEVRVIPRSKDQAAQAKKMARPDHTSIRLPPHVKLIAVLSGKGGVGKSTVSINLADALVQSGFRTAILDCDIYGFSVPDLLQVTEPAKTRERQLIPPRIRHIDVMSMKFFVGNNAPVMWRGPMLGKAIRQMMEDTVWDDPEYMVLDLPPGTGDIAMDVHTYFPNAAAVVVTSPDLNAARVAERAGQMARKLDRRLLGVVENLSYLECFECGHLSYPLGQGGGEIVARSLEIPILAKIPWVMSQEGGVVNVVPEHHPAHEIYLKLANTIHHAMNAPNTDPSMVNRVKI